MALKRKADDENNGKNNDDSPAASSSTSSAPREVRVKVERVGGSDRPIEVVDTSPTSDQLAESRKQGRAESTIKNARNNFLCPIGLTIMFKPVIAADGNNYEELTLVEVLKGRDTSPLDNVTKLSVEGLIQNRQLKNMVEEFVGSEDCPADMKKDWEEAKEESEERPKKLFEEGKVLESAKLGYPEAMGVMADNYALGRGGFGIDKAKAFEWATKAANAGDKNGIFMLGYCYTHGYGVPINYATALTWYKRCEDVDSNASNNIGAIYDVGGHGADQDYTKAVDYYRKAADQGNCMGQCNLAFMYCNGKGVQKSFTEARKWLKMAADQNGNYSQFYLGKMLIKGEGGVKDFLGGCALLQKSAAQGNADAKAKIEEIVSVV